MAVSIYNLPATLISAIALPLVPLLTSAVESSNREKEGSILASSFKMTALIAFPTGLGIAVFSKPILQLLFSSQKAEIDYTAPLLSLLGLSVFLSSMITITNAVLQAYMQAKLPIISMLFGTATKIVLSFILIGIPQINIYGAPISTFFSTLVIVAINLYFIAKRAVRLNSVYDLFGKSFISAILSVAIGTALYLALSHISPSRAVILAVIIAVAILYCIIALKLKAIDKQEVLMLPKGDKLLNILTKIHLM